MKNTAVILFSTMLVASCAEDGLIKKETADVLGQLGRGLLSSPTWQGGLAAGLGGSQNAVRGDAETGCSRTTAFDGEKVRCPDGNIYLVKRRSKGALLPSGVHTRVTGANARTGRTWETDFGESVFGPTMKGRDANGAPFSCVYSTVLANWDC